MLIFLPPREHEPPHVHVWKAGAEVVIELAGGSRPQTIREVSGMRSDDVATAFWIVQKHAEYLLEQWRSFHD